MNKKICAWGMIGLIIACGFSARVYFVNKDVQIPVTKEYKKGEVVPYEKDYTNGSYESIEGYTVAVLDSEVLSAEDFYKKYNISNTDIDDNMYVGWYCIVKLSFANVDNNGGTDSGIQLYYSTLTSKSDYILPDENAFYMLNPDMPGMGFSLHPGTSKEVLAVYPINSFNYADINDIENEGFKLQITQYPARKLIDIQ